MIKKIVAVTLIAFVFAGVSFAAPIEGKAAPVFKEATENAACDVVEGTISDLLTDKALICTNGKWRKVVFKTIEDGSTIPLYYDGQCSLRFEVGNKTQGRITLKAGEIADVCLPHGWKALVGAASNSYGWAFTYPKALPNVVLIRPDKSGSASTLWIYPVIHDGTLGEKLSIELRSKK